MCTGHSVIGIGRDDQRPSAISHLVAAKLQIKNNYYLLSLSLSGCAIIAMRWKIITIRHRRDTDIEINYNSCIIWCNYFVHHLALVNRRKSSLVERIGPYRRQKRLPRATQFRRIECKRIDDQNTIEDNDVIGVLIDLHHRHIRCK